MDTRFLSASSTTLARARNTSTSFNRWANCTTLARWRACAWPLRAGFSGVFVHAEQARLPLEMKPCRRLRADLDRRALRARTDRSRDRAQEDARSSVLVARADVASGVDCDRVCAQPSRPHSPRRRASDWNRPARCLARTWSNCKKKTGGCEGPNSGQYERIVTPLDAVGLLRDKRMPSSFPSLGNPPFSLS